MFIRVAFVIPIALIVWWFAYNIVRPDGENWIIWIMTSDASKASKTFWGLLCFAGTAAIAASLALFWRRSHWALAGVVALSYGFANVIGTGYHATSGVYMNPYDFCTLALGMCSSYPLTFSDQIAGKQVDVVGDET